MLEMRDEIVSIYQENVFNIVCPTSSSRVKLVFLWFGEIVQLET